MEQVKVRVQKLFELKSRRLSLETELEKTIDEINRTTWELNHLLSRSIATIVAINGNTFCCLAAEKYLDEPIILPVQDNKNEQDIL